MTSIHNASNIVVVCKNTPETEDDRREGERERMKGYRLSK